MKKIVFILYSILSIMTINCTAQPRPEFNADNAYKYLLKQCEFGPRNPGSEGYYQCRTYLKKTLALFADDVVIQSFMFSFGKPAKSITAQNIIAHFQPQISERILLCAHWDTRPWADMDADKANHDKPVLGANDGASGVAVLLEVARILHEAKPRIGVDIVLFDAEDAGEYSVDKSWAVGSQAFAREFGAKMAPRYGILLDMIGDADLNIYKEGFSAAYAGSIVNKVWNTANNLGLSEFNNEIKFTVTDDHLALLRVGIQCIDIIDFDYPHWHTLQDTPDKCSPASLGTVGTLLTELIYSEK